MPKYRTTVICTSIEGSVICMKKEDFLRLENQQNAWNIISTNAK